MRVVAATDAHAEGLQRCVDAVARERRYLGIVEGFTVEQTRAFVRAVQAVGGVQLVAVNAAGEVVGWCDVLRDDREGFTHVGRLGMGVLRAVRGRGIGRRLAESAVTAAAERGIERLELDVFASNAPAIGLYERLGFEREGVRRRARKLGDAYDDIVLMGLLLSR